MTDEARIALGHLVFELQDAVLSQGFCFDRDWIVQLMADAGLMREDSRIRALYPLSPLAEECVTLYLVKAGGCE